MMRSSPGDIFRHCLLEISSVRCFEFSCGGVSLFWFFDEISLDISHFHLATIRHFFSDRSFDDHSFFDLLKPVRYSGGSWKKPACQHCHRQKKQIYYRALFTCYRSATLMGVTPEICSDHL